MNDRRSRIGGESGIEGIDQLDMLSLMLLDRRAKTCAETTDRIEASVARIHDKRAVPKLDAITRGLNGRSYIRRNQKQRQLPSLTVGHRCRSALMTGEQLSYRLRRDNCDSRNRISRPLTT